MPILEKPKFNNLPSILVNLWKEEEIKQKLMTLEKKKTIERKTTKPEAVTLKKKKR